MPFALIANIFCWHSRLTQLFQSDRPLSRASHNQRMTTNTRDESKVERKPMETTEPTMNQTRRHVECMKEAVETKPKKMSSYVNDLEPTFADQFGFAIPGDVASELAHEALPRSIAQTHQAGEVIKAVLPDTGADELKGSDLNSRSVLSTDALSAFLSQDDLSLEPQPVLRNDSEFAGRCSMQNNTNLPVLPKKRAGSSLEEADLSFSLSLDSFRQSVRSLQDSMRDLQARKRESYQQTRNELERDLENAYENYKEIEIYASVVRDLIERSKGGTCQLCSQTLRDDNLSERAESNENRQMAQVRSKQVSHYHQERFESILKEAAEKKIEAELLKKLYEEKKTRVQAFLKSNDIDESSIEFTSATEALQRIGLL